MRRLYLQIYLAFLGIALLCMVVAAAAAHLLRDQDLPMHTLMRNAAAFLVEDLAGSDTSTAAGRAAVNGALRSRADRLGLHIALWDRDRALMGSSGPVPPVTVFPRQGSRALNWRRMPGAVTALPQGGWVFVGPRARDHAGAAGRTLAVLGLLMLIVAVGCFWIARRITRRLEGLRAGVEAWGSGALSAPVEVSGRDEVAELATSFNNAAKKIDSLLEEQKRVLANVSHELRSPLARLRMAVELLGEGEGEEKQEGEENGVDAVDRNHRPGRQRRLREEAVREIEELDELIGDLLLATRLKSAIEAPPFETVDLKTLLQEEASRVDARFTGQGLEVSGEPRMLRRLARNLLENARRHGGGTEIRVALEPLATALFSGLRIAVEDGGPGVAEQDRERIFEPFYRPRGHAESKDGGVGLGLSLVKQIAEHHGGTVRCLPRDGGGTRFEVLLPLGQVPTRNAEQPLPGTP